MDNISHSLPRRSFSNGGAFFASHNSVYDDVFGCPPKFDIPTLLAPRADDYSEIFCTSRSSSCIPFLQLPIISDLSNRSPSFDYTEVFGDFGAFAVTPSFHDLLAHDDEEEDSSHEPWSPAQSGSLSDELDPLNGSEKSCRLSDVDVHQSFQSIEHFNASYNKSTQRNSETLLTGTSRVTNFCAVPGYTFSPCESSVSWNGEDEHCSVDLSPLEKPGTYTSPQDKPFITVSDISLRTKPSKLPPPSRPPPALVVEKRECDRSNSKIKSSKSYAFDRVVDDSASLFIDVEVDATISAVGRENKNNRVKHESTKEETLVSVPVTEDRIGSTKGTEETSGIGGVQHRDSADNSALDVAWKEETEYFEVIEKNISKQAFDMVENYNTSTRLMNRDSYRNPRMTNCDIFNQKEDSKKFKATKEAPKWDEERNQLEMTADDYCERGNKQQQEMQNTRLIDQKRFQENVKLSKLAHLYDFDTPIPKNFQQLGDSEMLEIDHSDETVEELKESKGNVTAVEARLKASLKGMDIQKRYVDARVIKRSSGKHQQNILREECERGHEDVKGADSRERVKKTTDPEGAEKQHNGVPGKENESKLKETHELKENFMILKEAMEHVESVNKSCIAAEHEKNENGELACGVDEGEERFMEADKQKVNGFTFREALAQARNEKEIKLIHKTEVTEERNRDASKPEYNHLIFRLAETEIGNKGEVFETKGNASLSRDVVEQEDLEIEPTKTNGHEREVKWDMDGHVLLEGDRLKVLDEGCQLQQTTKTKVLEKHELLDGNTLSAANITMEFPCLHNEMRNSNNCGSGVGVSRVMPEKKSFEVEESHEPEKIISTKDDGGQKMKTQFISKRVDSKDSFTQCEVIRESLVKVRKVDDASSVLKHSDDTLHSLENSTTQRIERKDKNIKDSIAAKDGKVEERVRRQTELENEHIRKVEEEREREREREKDRMAVNKAALERSYIEARERTERAAVERATAEVRQRAMAGARERLEKTSMEAKHRVERAAVERANAEARQRAVEKSMAQKVASDTRDRVETSFPDRFPASFKSDTRQSSLSSDLHFQTTAISNGLRYSSSSAHVVAEGESPQRCKARLERYRRTAERAANALAEKNRRDLLAQREREERNRVAESLDAELKRWSNGKEGNLRALLSTLQYILGHDSGWQPVPLTEVITIASVKKAYRKATLFVHPDKLQQRGATIQQKYICEKVFDLLKEAWNKFNSEER